MSLKSWLKFAYLGVVWGSTFLWIKIGLREIPPITFTAVRLLVAVIGLVVINLLFRSARPTRASWKDFLFLGMFNIALPFVLITWSEQYVATGAVSILSSTTPLFTLLIAPYFVPEERLTWVKVIGIITGFAGVVVLVVEQPGSEIGPFQWGELVVLLAALSYAAAVVYARRRTHTISPAWQALGQNIFATLILWPLAFSMEKSFVLPKAGLTWLAIIWLGIMATGIGTFLYYNLLNEIGPTRTTLISYAYPLMGVLLGAVFLGEEVGWQTVVGGTLILAGVILVNSSFSFRLGRTESEKRTL